MFTLNLRWGAQEEFLSAYGEQVAVAARQEAIQQELEACGEDMEKMAALLDELQARLLPFWSIVLLSVVGMCHEPSHEAV